MDGRASLYAVTFCSFCKGRLVPPILNTCLKTHQKKAKLLLVVLCSGLCWRASWQLAPRVCIKHCKADRIVPFCTYFLHRMHRMAFHSFLFGGGGVPFSEHGSAILTKGFRIFSQFHEDITGIVPHIWPQLFPSISFPTYFSLFILTCYVV
jgi:hypothetical protein